MVPGFIKINYNGPGQRVHKPTHLQRAGWSQHVSSALSRDGSFLFWFPRLSEQRAQAFAEHMEAHSHSSSTEISTETS